MICSILSCHVWVAWHSHSHLYLWDTVTIKRTNDTNSHSPSLLPSQWLLTPYFPSSSFLSFPYNTLLPNIILSSPSIPLFMEPSTKSRFRRICVYCGSSPGKSPSYQLAAVQLGKQLASIYICYNLYVLSYICYTLKAERRRKYLLGFKDMIACDGNMSGIKWFVVNKMCVGGEEDWLGLWRRKHRVDGSNLTSCVWWWTPRVRVSHRSLLLSLSSCFFIYAHESSRCYRVIPKTLNAREVQYYLQLASFSFHKK